MPSKPPVEEKLVLGSPPMGYDCEVREERYLTHCTNIAYIIAHSPTPSAIEPRVREYLRITKDEEMA